MLVVEDERPGAADRRDVLDRHGYRVVRLQSGESAVSTVENDSSIDIVLMAIGSRCCEDGAAAATDLSSRRDVPIVFLIDEEEGADFDRLRSVARYGFVPRDAGEFVLVGALDTAFRLFEARTEAETRRSYLETALNTVSEAVVATDERGTVTTMNPAASVLTGIGANGGIGRPIDAVLRIEFEERPPTGAPQPITALLDRALDGERVILTESGRVYRRDGTRSPDVRVSVSPIRRRDGAVSGAVVVLRAVGSPRDTVAQYDTGDALRLREGHLRAIFESSDDAMYLKDRERRYLRINPAAEHIFGRSAHELIGRRVEDVFSYQDAAHSERIDRRVLDGETMEYEDCSIVGGQMRVFDVKARPVRDDAGEIVGVCGVARDITERLERELAYSHVLTAALDGFLAVDADGAILDVNPAATSMLGYGEAELLSMRLADLDADDDDETVRRVLAEVRTSGAGRFERRLVRRDGTTISVEVSVSALPQSTDRFVAFVRDIGEQKLTVELLRCLGRSEQRTTLLNDATALIRRACGLDRVAVTLGADQESIADPEWSLDSPYPSEAAVPITHGAELVGILWLADRREGVLDDDRLDLFRRLASHLGLGLKRLYAQEALRESTANLEGLIESSDDIIVLRDRSGSAVVYNEAFAETCYRLFGVRGFKGINTISLLDGESRENWDRNVERVLEGESIRERFQHTFDDGDVRWYDRKFSPILRDGLVTGFAEFTRDITDLHDIEQRLTNLLQEKDYLMTELNHRVKNNFALVSSLINLKSASANYAVDLTDLRNQLEAIRSAHEKLTVSRDGLDIDLRAYVQDILRTVFLSVPGTPVQVEIDVPQIALPAKTTVTLGLLINEAATNAVQHGFEPGVPAEFSAVFTRKMEDGQCELRLCNSGKPFPEGVGFDEPDTLGLRLMCALACQLKGSIEILRGERTCLRVRFSCPADAAGQ